MRPPPPRRVHRRLHGQPEVPQLAARLRRLHEDVLELDVPVRHACVAAVSRVAAVFGRSRGVDATRLRQRRRWAVSVSITGRLEGTLPDTDERALRVRVGQRRRALPRDLDDDIERKGHATRGHMVQ